jgi:hypothetical protein
MAITEHCTPLIITTKNLKNNKKEEERKKKSHPFSTCKANVHKQQSTGTGDVAGLNTSVTLYRLTSDWRCLRQPPSHQLGSPPSIILHYIAFFSHPYQGFLFGYRSKMVAKWGQTVGYRRFTCRSGSQIP